MQKDTEITLSNGWNIEIEITPFEFKKDGILVKPQVYVMLDMTEDLPAFTISSQSTEYSNLEDFEHCVYVKWNPTREDWWITSNWCHLCYKGKYMGPAYEEAFLKVFKKNLKINIVNPHLN